MGKQLVVLHVLKRFVEGDDHLNGEVSVFNTHQESVLDDARRFTNHKNYTLLHIVLMQYGSEHATVHTHYPTGEVARWSLF